MLTCTAAAWGCIPLALHGGRAAGVALVVASATFALSAIFALDTRPAAQRAVAAIGIVGALGTGGLFVVPFFLQS